MTAIYHRTTDFDREDLGDEVVLMEVESQALVALNPTGRAVWDVLENGTTLDEIDALFHDAFPTADRAAMRRDVSDVLDTLIAARLVFTEDT